MNMSQECVFICFTWDIRGRKCGSLRMHNEAVWIIQMISVSEYLFSSLGSTSSSTAYTSNLDLACLPNPKMSLKETWERSNRFLGLQFLPIQLNTVVLLVWRYPWLYDPWLARLVQPQMSIHQPSLWSVHFEYTLELSNWTNQTK